MNECIADDCTKQAKIKGAQLCRAHYQKKIKYGNPNSSAPKKSREELFWAMVDKTESCWEWQGFRTPKGYGKFTHGPAAAKTTGRAHRISYEMTAGPIPDGMHLDHTCHNRGCVNPAHLRVCTNKQNQENRTGAMANSGTGVRGVFLDKRRGRHYGRVTHNQVHHHLGYFDTVAEAEAAVVAKRLELFTHNLLDRV